MDAEDVVVPGARLHTETRGSGPLLLLVVGGNGDPTVFDPVADLLAARWTVVTYVRRGFVRSPVDDGPAGRLDDKLAADVDDAAALIERHGGPASVMGSSSGAVVALELLVRRPDLVARVVAHEPPLTELLDDAAAWRQRFADVLATYRAEGLVPAMAAFGEAVGMRRPPVGPGQDEVPPAIAAMRGRWPANTAFWFEHEYGPYPRHHLDLDALARHADRLVLSVGATSVAEGQMASRPAAVLAGRLGTQVTEMPGAHLGYVEDPPAFAAALEGALTPRSA